MARIDQRAPDALRPVTLQREYTRGPAGSVLACFGETRVLCTASIAERVPPWLRDSGKGWVTAEYAMLPGASAERIPRDHTRKGRAMEISRLIGRSLRAVVDLYALGEQVITLDCDVIQADGGTRTAAITGAFVALHDAVHTLMADGRLTRSPLMDHCAAVSVGVVEGEVLLDLCYAEDSAAEVDMNVVMDGQGRFIEVQGCAEGMPFHRARLDAMLDSAAAGITQLMAAQRTALGLAPRTDG